MYRVVGEPNLVRDEQGVLHNVNIQDYRSFITQRQNALDNKRRIENLEMTQKDMSNKLDLILQLLKDNK